MVLDLLQTIALWVFVGLAVVGWLSLRKSVRDRFVSERKVDLLVELTDEISETTKLLSGWSTLETVNWEKDGRQGLFRALSTELLFLFPEAFDVLSERLEDIPEDFLEGDSNEEAEKEKLTEVMSEWSTDIRFKATIRFAEIQNHVQRILTELRLLRVGRNLAVAIGELLSSVEGQSSKLTQETLWKMVGLKDRVEFPNLEGWVKDVGGKLDNVLKLAQREIDRALSPWRLV